MTKKTFLLLFLICFLYISVLYISNKKIFSYSFNPDLIRQYFLSQDIPHEVAGKRLFLSDTNIYLVSGYLYAKGADPTIYNFDHPPLIKYLYGFSIILFNTPYPVQIGFGIMVLSLSYFLGIKIFKIWQIPFLTCLFLIADPLFLDITANPLLDLGQTAFLLLYLLSILFFEDKLLLSGLALGLFAASKSWIAPAFFLIIISVLQIYKNKFNLRKTLLQIIIAFILYCSFYLVSFINHAGKFNIIFFILKTMKYRIQHNSTPFIGAPILLFLIGYVKSWWGSKSFIQSNTWSIFWPIGFLISLKQLFPLSLKKINHIKILAIFTICYFIFLIGQAPFPRYFIIILPFVYLNLANFIFTNFKQWKSVKKLFH